MVGLRSAVYSVFVCMFVCFITFFLLAMFAWNKHDDDDAEVTSTGRSFHVW